MPKFVIESSSKFNKEQTYEKVKTYLDKEQEKIKKFDPSVALELDDENKKGQLKGRSLKAQFDIEESGDQCHVSVHVDIPFILTPMKGKITSILEHQLKKYLT